MLCHALAGGDLPLPARDGGRRPTAAALNFRAGARRAGVDRPRGRKPGDRVAVSLGYCYGDLAMPAAGSDATIDATK